MRKGSALRRIWPWPTSFTLRERDDAKSMNNLGSMYERGTGVAKDLAEARKWYEQAAELGNEDARANVERVKEKIKKKAGK